MMEEKHQRDLEELIQRELDQLPELEAPSTLIPRVLNAIRAQENAPWWRQPWLAWPWPVRVASLLALGSIPVMMFYGALLGSKSVGAVVSRDLAHWFTGLSLVISALQALGGALLAVLRSIQTPWLLGGVGVAFVIYLGCVGIGSLCFQLTFNRQSSK